MTWRFCTKSFVPLIDCKMTQTEVRKVAEISSSTLTTVDKDSPVTSGVSEEISRALNCRRKAEDLPSESDSSRIQTRLLGARLRHSFLRR